MTGIADRVHVRTAKGRTQFFKKVHREVDAFMLIVHQLSIPLGKFVADFDRPRHANNYTLYGIYRKRYIMVLCVEACCRAVRS